MRILQSSRFFAMVPIGFLLLSLSSCVAKQADMVRLEKHFEAKVATLEQEKKNVAQTLAEANQAIRESQAVLAQQKSEVSELVRARAEMKSELRSLRENLRLQTQPQTSQWIPLQQRETETVPPTITIDAPVLPPNQSHLQVDHYTQIIRGHVQDASGVVTVLLNKQAVRLEADGRFAGKVRLAIGANTITVEAEDVPGNVATRTLTLIRQPFIPEDALADVDVPPARARDNPHGVGVLIGIEAYQHVPPATYAYHDAEVMREYVAATLGFHKDRLALLTNREATEAAFKKYLGAGGWLQRRIEPGQSDVVVYFSGHGMADFKTQQRGLLPYDVDPNYSAGYDVAQLYKDLAGLGARSVTVFLDACFTGQSREHTMLRADARPVQVVVAPSVRPAGLTIFAAASGLQISGAVAEQEHGLFTYYVLKGLGGVADVNADRTLTVGELGAYLQTAVAKRAALQDREQTPEVHGETSRMLTSW